MKFYTFSYVFNEMKFARVETKVKNCKTELAINARYTYLLNFSFHWNCVDTAADHVLFGTATELNVLSKYFALIT